jgi:6-phosphofructokinase 1
MSGKGFAVLAVAEGAISKEDSLLSSKEYKKKIASSPHPTVSFELAEQIGEIMGTEVRVCVPGHTQRGGPPSPFDRVLTTRLGAAAAQLIVKEDYGYTVSMINGETKKVPLEEVAGQLKMVDPDSQLVQEAKTIGICFGD